MNMKTVIPLGLAIVLGLVAAILVRNAISHHGASTVASSNTVSVVVAKQDAEPGTSLGKDDLSVARVPADLAPDHVFSDPAQLVGRVVTTQLLKGQTIVDTLLAPAGTGQGLQALIPPGMRAVTIEVNQFSGVGGMLEPGCKVDLVSVINDPKTHESISRTILQNIKVTAIGRSVTPSKPVDGQPLPPPANDVTLLVLPKQVQLLELASTASRPWLVLRSTRDGQQVDLEQTSLAMLTGSSDGDNQTQNISAPAAPASPFEPVSDTTEQQPAMIRRTVTFIRGGVESQQTFMVPNPRYEGGNVDADTKFATPDTH